MHDQPLTVREDDSVVDVAGLMVKQKPKIYPVLDSGDPAARSQKQLL